MKLIASHYRSLIIDNITIYHGVPYKLIPGHATKVAPGAKGRHQPLLHWSFPEALNLQPSGPNGKSHISLGIFWSIFYLFFYMFFYVFLCFFLVSIKVYQFLQYIHVAGICNRLWFCAAEWYDTALNFSEASVCCQEWSTARTLGGDMFSNPF